MKKALALVLVVALVCSCVFANGSQESSSAKSDVKWPTGTVKLYNAAKAGANLDIKSRLVAKYLTEELGVPVVVENRPGAGGITACTQYLSESPNSNTIQYLAASHLAVAPIYNEVSYTENDFITVAGLDVVENGFFVDARLGISSLEELKEWGQGKIVKFASAGVGNDSFLLSKVLLNDLGLQSDSVNGAGFPDAIVNVISGNASVCYCALNTAKQYVAEGSLVPLAVYNASSYKGYADVGYASVPSLKELGFDIEYSTITWFSLRAGTDQKIVDKLAAALNKVYANPEFQAELNKAGFFMMEDTSTSAVAATVERMVKDCNAFATRI